MAGYEGMFGKKVQESMLDMDTVAAELVGRSGLGWDGEAEDDDSDGGADEEGVSRMEPSRSPVGLHVEWR
jgi:hypothetical protein